VETWGVISVPTVGTQKFRLHYNLTLLMADMALKGWLPTHLARAASVSDMTVSRFLSGDIQTAPTAKKLAKALGYSVRRYLLIPADATSDEARV
jgi:transcriptional regulator with XRE-family HTH domain